MHSMIKTADQYAQAVATFDQDRINAMIDRIPWNVNRSGKVYLKRIAKIKQDYATQQLNQRNRNHPRAN